MTGSVFQKKKSKKINLGYRFGPHKVTLMGSKKFCERNFFFQNEQQCNNETVVRKAVRRARGRTGGILLC